MGDSAEHRDPKNTFKGNYRDNWLKLLMDLMEPSIIVKQNLPCPK